MKAPRHIEDLGVVGSIIAAACCLGISAIASLVAAVGLGFLLTDAVLMSLLVISLGIAIWGLAAGWRRHGELAPLGLGSAGAVVLAIAVFVLYSRPIAYVGFVALIGAAILNVVANRRYVRRPS